MGVLFLTNEGYSTMCGHATIAVSRMLVDHIGSHSAVFPIASKLNPVDTLNDGQIQYLPTYDGLSSESEITL